jgi:hypothetical protein
VSKFEFVVTMEKVQYRSVIRFLFLDSKIWLEIEDDNHQIWVQLIQA